MSAGDLERALAHLDATLLVSGDISADVLALDQRLGTEDPTWWVGPQGDDVRRQVLDVATSASTATSAWDAVGAALVALRTSASAHHDELVRLESERDGAGGFLERLWRQATDAIDDLVAHEGRIDRQAAEVARIERAIETVGVRWHADCRRAATAVGEALAAVEGSTPEAGTIRVGRLTLPTGEALAALQAVLLGHLPDADDAAAVARWFESLDVQERMHWIHDAPQIVGNTDGVPYDHRILANRIHMQELVDSLEPGDPLLATLEQFLLPGSSLVDPTRQFVFFDPAGDGRVAELFGDLATASQVAVLVPGMGSTMANFTSGVGSNARSLFAGSPGTAVIAWTGYDAPAGIEQGLDALEVTSDAQARAGGAYLASFVDGLHLEHDAPTTLVGHSYGSATTGQALLQGAQVDNVVFIGSPGVGVDHVSEFPPGAADRYYAGEIDGDPVATFEQFGDAPTDPDFGAIRFDAGSSDALNPLARHSEYYAEGPGLDNLATIVEGGTPTLDSPRPSEHVLELLEDIDDGLHHGVDVVQERVDLPLVDGAVDSVVDGVQTVDRKLGDVSATIVETTDNVASSAVGHARDFIDEHVDVDLTFWN